MTDTTIPTGATLLTGPRIFSQLAIDACINRLWAVIGHALRADRGDEDALMLFNDKVRELDYHAYIGKDADDLFLAFRDLWNGYTKRNVLMRDMMNAKTHWGDPLRAVYIVPDGSEEYEAFMCLDCCGALTLLGIE
jgi:hypothetical protein